MMITLLATDKS